MELWMLAIWGPEDKLTIVPFLHISSMCIHKRGRVPIIEGWNKQTLGASPVILTLISTLFLQCGNPPTSLVFPVLLNKSRIWFIKYLVQRCLPSSSSMFLFSVSLAYLRPKLDFVSPFFLGGTHNVQSFSSLHIDTLSRCFLYWEICYQRQPYNIQDSEVSFTEFLSGTQRRFLKSYYRMWRGA